MQSNRTIAAALGVSVSTVAGHLRAACSKLGGARRLDLIREWIFGPARADGESSAEPPRPPGLAVLRAGVDCVELVLDVEAPLPGFTDAERAVLCAVLQGKTNAQIAADRGRSARTVANQVARLFKKTGVSSRAELIARVGGCPRGSTSPLPALPGPSP